ncbi:MAG: hypothetical protein AABY32_03980 [Nanoarchaeota archaeon]
MDRKELLFIIVLTIILASFLAIPIKTISDKDTEIKELKQGAILRKVGELYINDKEEVKFRWIVPITPEK